MYMPDLVFHLTMHRLLSKSPLARKLHFYIFCIRVFFFLFISYWLIIMVCPLWFVVYIWFVIYHYFVIFGISFLLQLQNSGVILRLCCIFLLQQSCWASPLCADNCITWDMCCYHQYNDYSSNGELKCWMMIINLSPNHSLNLFCLHPLSSSWANQCCCLTKDEWPETNLSCYVVFGMMHSLASGSDKEYYYTHGLANYILNSGAMSMPLWNSLKFGSIQRKNNEILIVWVCVLVNHLADSDHWWMSVLTHAHHTVLHNMFLM